MEELAGTAGWLHAEVGLDHLVKHVGAFLDMLILASGCQSDGSPAVWTPQSLRKALDWACYLEEVLNSLPDGKQGDESRQTLDMAIGALLKKEPLPPGMTKISSAELGKARSLIVQILVQALPAENAWLIADVVQESGHEELWESVIREISERCIATGCVKSLQRASELAARFSTSRKQDCARDVDIWQTPQVTAEFKSYKSEDWINEGLLYVTSAETIHKLSGAVLIFSADQTQWAQAFDSLLSRPDRGLTCIRVEIAELCCLFLASPRWRFLPRKFFHLSCNSSKRALSFEDCWWVKEPTPLDGNGESFSSKSQEVEKYLQNLLTLEKDMWLKLHPILLAVGLSESSLLEEYIEYIGGNMVDTSSSGCHAHCMCVICQRRSDARQRSGWCLLMLNQRPDFDNPPRKDISGDHRWPLTPPPKITLDFSK